MYVTIISYDNILAIPWFLYMLAGMWIKYKCLCNEHLGTARERNFGFSVEIYNYLVIFL